VTLANLNLDAKRSSKRTVLLDTDGGELEVLRRVLKMVDFDVPGVPVVGDLQT